MTLSVVIIAKDEERTIGSVIDAISDIASEIILVDSGSTDNTVTIAEERGAKCSYQKWLGYAAQKNHALSLAAGEWVLSLDADEVVTKELKLEIEDLLSTENCKNFLGYKIPRALYIGDIRVGHGGFYPDAQLRLIQRGAGKFNDRLVHEAIKIDGPVSILKNEMKHYAYKNISEFEEAMDKYARLSAEEFAKRNNLGWRLHPINAIVHPIWTFIYRYIFRAGFLDGKIGLDLATIYSDYVKKKICYLKEKKSQP